MTLLVMGLYFFFLQPVSIFCFVCVVWNFVLLLFVFVCFARQEMTIHGPKGGDLQVSIHSREFSFYGVKIFSNETQNMNIDISRMMGDHVGAQMTIDASDATGRLSVTCEADCDESTIKCPTNSLSNNCNIDCSNANGNFKCKQMNIYAPEGWSSVELSLCCMYLLFLFLFLLLCFVFFPFPFLKRFWQHIFSWGG